HGSQHTRRRSRAARTRQARPSSRTTPTHPGPLRPASDLTGADDPIPTGSPVSLPSPPPQAGRRESEAEPGRVGLTFPASAGYQRCLRGLYRVQAAKPEGETAPMPAPIRPRRSVLFMPASNPRALEKARTLPADGLIFDLEDAVAPEAKESARASLSAALAAGGYGGRELVLRVNALDTPWGHADLAAAAAMPLDAVLLPKVETPDRVSLTVSLLDLFA